MSYDALRKGRYSGAGCVYLVTAITAGRADVFSDWRQARRLVRVMRQLHDEKIVDSFAWVVMPDHFHWLFSLGEGVDLCLVMKSVKGRSARAINRARGSQGAVWQRAFHDHAVRGEEDLHALARYVVANPLRAGLVTDIGMYPHWDAAWLDPLSSA